jgi:1-deoxy-D-xylulose-5-phosphate reductoisomerase
VQAFLDGKIKLSEIAKINESVMDSHNLQQVTTLETVLDADTQARKDAESLIQSKYFAAR